MRAGSGSASRFRLGRASQCTVSAAAAAALIAGCTAGGTTGSAGFAALSAPSYPVPTMPAPTPLPTTPSAALSALEHLKINTAHVATPSTTAAFGPVRHPAGSSTACTSTDIVLQRDLVKVKLQSGSTCRVATGALFDVYSAKWLWYIRAKASLDQVTIDHVVSLPNAWVSGAYAWPTSVLSAFANDPLELRAAGINDVTVKANRDAAGWLPANPQGRCIYAVAQVAVKTKYLLWVTAAEKAALVRVLAGCPATVTPPHATTQPPPIPTPTKAARKPKPRP